LGTVGEPINPRAWKWYYKHIGGEDCPVVDTWWQSETGGIMVTTLPGVGEMKPGSAGPPLPGIDAQVVDADGNAAAPGEAGYLTIDRPWPGMLRGADDGEPVADHWRRSDEDDDPETDEWVYVPEDGAKIDDDGYITILGRVDDVLNISGHRLGTMEIESAIVGVEGVAEAAVVDAGDEIHAYVCTQRGYADDAALKRAVVESIRAAIGPVAVPDRLVFTPELPKTRSGKIMRRLLEDIASGAELGDISTLRNPEIVGELRARIEGTSRTYLDPDE
ncbi:MAG: AMP-binding protein, partial [Natronomonas sp.]